MTKAFAMILKWQVLHSIHDVAERIHG